MNDPGFLTGLIIGFLLGWFAAFLAAKSFLVWLIEEIAAGGEKVRAWLPQGFKDHLKERSLTLAQITLEDLAKLLKEWLDAKRVERAAANTRR